VQEGGRARGHQRRRHRGGEHDGRGGRKRDEAQRGAESTAVAELGRAHPSQKRRRHHAAPDNWRCRVANVDHRQRVGITSRHVCVRAAHGDGYRLCAQQVTRERERV
jgi:hypothetical protein